jgi:hypothetical protein
MQFFNKLKALARIIRAANQYSGAYDNLERDSEWMQILLDDAQAELLDAVLVAKGLGINLNKVGVLS